jgi:hypothetical protein
MATSWTTVSVSDITSIGTSNQQTAAISVAPNEGLSLDVQSTVHANDDLTVRLQVSNDGGTTWATSQEFTIPAPDTDAKSLGMIIGAPHVRIQVFAEANNDNPTLSTRAKRGPLNGA